jgi:hypothetical protein
MDVVLKLPWGSIVLPILFWAPAFAIVTLIVNLFVIRWCRRRLRAAGKLSGKATLLLVLLQGMAMPIFAGTLGVSFAMHRGVAKLVEASAAPMMDVTVDISAKVARQILADNQLGDDSTIISLADARTRVEAGLASHPMPKIDGFAALTRMRPLLENMFWSAAKRELDGWTDADGDVTVAKVMTKTKTLLHKEGTKGFGWVADGMRSGAKQALIVLGLLLVVVNGLTIALVRRSKPLG